jgi:hypothetical protein
MQFQIGSFILQNFTSLKNHIQDVFVGFKKGVGTEKNIFYKWTVYQIMSYNSEQKRAYTFAEDKYKRWN